MPRSPLAAVLCSLSVLCIPGVALAGPSDETPSTLTPIQITVVGCSEDGDSVPSVTAHDDHDGPIRIASHLAHLDGSSGVFSLQATFAQGANFVTAKSPHCTGLKEVGVLSGQPRHATIVLGDLHVINDSDCVIAGTLPASGLSIALKNENGTSEPIVVDGRAYYFEGAGLGDYELVIDLGMLGTLRIPISLHDANGHRAGICWNQFVVRNVLPQELASGKPLQAP